MATKAKAGRAAKGTGAKGTGENATGANPATAVVVAERTPPAEGKLSALAAAAKVLAEAGTALTCKELVGVMAAKGYWTSPGGKTPEATLHAAISTEIKKKGDAARFRKAAPGRFAAAGAPGTLPPATAGRKAAGRKRTGAPADPVA
ncbi:MAG TPA: winged helix-turn-helix domain-containing protein [Urbifossiella sp.]|nr:winged helix-turn-helix domain-containing protein [Urbifossiella sp.]